MHAAARRDTFVSLLLAEEVRRMSRTTTHTGTNRKAPNAPRVRAAVTPLAS
jgi:hypothetical protein